MTLTRIAELCRGCPFEKSCDHKHMEALACLEPVDGSETIDIRVCGKTVSVDKKKYQKMQISKGYSEIQLKDLYYYHCLNTRKTLKEAIRAELDIKVGSLHD